MKHKLLLLFTVATLLISCSGGDNAKQQEKMKHISSISEEKRKEVIRRMTDSLGEANSFRIERGVTQTADLWREEDGTEQDFADFCCKSFVADSTDLYNLFNRLEHNFETLSGYYHKIAVDLQAPVQLEGISLTFVDLIFAGYDASAHMTEDFFANKIAFIKVLNFPFYTLEEKTEKGVGWSRQQWAYARMGDRFMSRVPADVQQQISVAEANADAYTSDYNICMGGLRNNDGKQLFPDGMKLITHWGLRDELKADYADAEHGLEKQRMIYQVMKRIIDQTIPLEVINKEDCTWNPYSNETTVNGKQIKTHPEEMRRYQMFLDNFHAMSSLDAYSSNYQTALSRAFQETMEIPQQDVEKLFVDLLSSAQVKKVAKLIQKRLGRPLEPFDIWYEGFTSGNAISEDLLTAITSRKYPNPAAVKEDLPDILMKLGWKRDRAEQICSMVEVDPSRGAGHAWGAEMRGDEARLRTRIGDNGMDYKGYNIAVHEFGHNVEQIITMNDVDFYSLTGVPNTAFTEAIAFLFQQRDLQLLGLKNIDPNDVHYTALNVFWSCYEIMGVSLVDIAVWKWLYAHPNANATQLKQEVIELSKEVWNKYYAGILGGEDEVLLGIYSHMIDYPLYLPNYPIGHLISFQINQYVSGKNLADELERMLKQGRLVPQLWMRNAVGSPISIEPLLSAVDKALEVLD